MPRRLPEACGCLWRHACNVRTSPRSFSTSTPPQAQIPPESPKFIDVPRPVQPYQPRPVHMKGTLPVPRPVIRRKFGPQQVDKSSPGYLASVTPEPIEANRRSALVRDQHVADVLAWKARQSEARRRNLREGLVELSDRKLQSQRRTEARSAKNRAEREALLYAPEREDERLTSSSVLHLEQPKKYYVLPDPGREARLARKRENLAKMEALEEEHRRNALHTLYVNAGDFITTGAQLDATIDRVFDDWDQFTNDSKPGMNIWNIGYPETVAQLLAKSDQTSRRGSINKKATDDTNYNADITRARMRKIAEELTGGKMLDTP